MNNTFKALSQVDKRLIHMISFSNFIDIYWNDDEKDFNDSINQYNSNLFNKLEHIQAQRNIFNLLTIHEVRIIIQDLYLRRSLFIHKLENQTPNKNKIKLEKIFLKIFDFFLSKKQFDEIKIKFFLQKYKNYLTSIVFLRYEEKDIFLNPVSDPYEQYLLKILLLKEDQGYFEENSLSINWYNQYFYNKAKDFRVSGRRYESFLLFYCFQYQQLFKNQNLDLNFKNYFLHTIEKRKHNQKIILNKRHYNNYLTVNFTKVNKFKNKKVNHVITLDYRIFLLLEIITRINHKTAEEKQLMMEKIIFRAIKLTKYKNKFLSIMDFFFLFFDKQEIKEFQKIQYFLESWFNDEKKQNKKKNQVKFIRKNFIKAFFFLKINEMENFGKFLKKYKNINFNEFAFYYFVKNNKDSKISLSEIWLEFLENSADQKLPTIFINENIKRELIISKYKKIIVQGTSYDFLRYFHFINGKNHLLRLSKNKIIKNNNLYSLNFIFMEIHKNIYQKLFNLKDNILIIDKYENLKNNSDFFVHDSLVHNYRNYIAHFGRQNQDLFLNYHDYVAKKWQVMKILQL